MFLWLWSLLSYYLHPAVHILTFSWYYALLPVFPSMKTHNSPAFTRHTKRDQELHQAPRCSSQALMVFGFF